MSELTTALDRIMAWLTTHSPQCTAGFQPGLSPEAIAEKLQTLPFEVSPEVHELYTWRNGDTSLRSIFVYHWLLDLDRACEIAQDSLNDEELLEIRAEEGEPQYLLPLFEFDGEFFAVPAAPDKSSVTPVFHLSDCYDVSNAFVSLTAMMQTLAECYETNIYKIRPSGDPAFPDNPEIPDMEPFKQIREKHNPGITDSRDTEGW